MVRARRGEGPRRPEITLVDVRKWVRVQFGGVYVADSRRVKLLRFEGRRAVYLFPEEDVDGTSLIDPTDQGRTKILRGAKPTWWTVRAGGKVAEQAAWTHTEIREGTPDIRGYVGFQWDSMDAWFEEEEEIRVHPRDPAKRIDDLPSSRHVTVEIAGELVADSRRPVVLFETGLPERYYIPKTDVRVELLVPSDTVTRCPYKGISTYYSLRAGDEFVEDVAWCIRYPTLEASRVANHICFYDEHADAVYVDGQRREFE